MKKFILLLALLFGAPSFAFADTIGCVLGTAVGVGLGSKIGQGNGTVAAQVILGLGGCDTGSRIEDGTYGRNRPRVDTVIVQQGSYGQDYYPQGGYVGGRGPSCYDQGSGGHVDCDEYYRRDRSRNVSYPRQQQYTQRAVYHPEQSVSRTVNMFERPEARVQKVAEKVAAKESRLTVDNYMQVDEDGNGAVLKQCQTKNWGVASVCLKKWSKKLEELQVRCVAGEQNPECEMNPGVVSKEAADLAEALEKKQEDAQGGKFVSN